MTGLDKYLKKTAQYLKCSKRTRKGIIRSLRGYMEDMVDGNLELSYEELCDIFHKTPKEMAATYYDEIPEMELFLHKVKAIVTVAVSIIIVFLVFFWTMMNMGDHVIIIEPPVEDAPSMTNGISTSVNS